MICRVSGIAVTTWFPEIGPFFAAFPIPLVLKLSGRLPGQGNLHFVVREDSYAIRLIAKPHRYCQAFIHFHTPNIGDAGLLAGEKPPRVRLQIPRGYYGGKQEQKVYEQILKQNAEWLYIVL